MIDFLPNRIRLQRKRRRLLVRQGVWVGFCALGLMFYAYVKQTDIRAAQAELIEMRTNNQNLQEQMLARDLLEKQQAELEIARKVEEQLGSRVGALDVLAELGDKMPTNMALTNLTFETVEQRVAVEMANRSHRANVATAKREKPVTRIRLTITGISTNDVDIANFIAYLSVSPLFEDVNMGYVKPVEFRGESVREFQCACYVSK